MITRLTGTIVEIDGVDDDATETLFFSVIDLHGDSKERIVFLEYYLTFNSILERSS